MVKTKSSSIPFIGIVSDRGYVESYDYETAEKYDFHHSLALSQKACEIYDNENTLRFVMYKGTNTYTLEGNPALDPFNKGKKQIELFAAHVIENGADYEMNIQIAEHNLSTEFERKCIGKLKDWIYI